MDFAEKLSVIYSDFLKQTSDDNTRAMLTGLVEDTVWSILKDGKTISSVELHSHIDEIYQVAKSNRDKDVA